MTTKSPDAHDVAGSASPLAPPASSSVTSAPSTERMQCHIADEADQFPACVTSSATGAHCHIFMRVNATVWKCAAGADVRMSCMDWSFSKR
jgi:hypothetical protein